MKSVTNKRNLTVIAVLALLGILLPTHAASQKEYPLRPIQIVVASAAGGTLDIHARAIAPVLERLLGQPVIVVDKPGAAGAVATQFVATSKPDGYTVLIHASSISWIPEVDILFGRPPTYTCDQFSPIALLSADPVILLTKSESPWKNVSALVADAKARPNTIRYGSAGLYNASHLPMEMFLHSAGVKMRHIPYAGGGPALTALLGGHVDVLSGIASTSSAQMKAGTVRILAGAGEKRIKAIPEVPTFKELGYDVESYMWVGLLAHKATPPAVLKILREGVRKAVDSTDFKSVMEKMQTPIVYLDADDFQKFWDKDARRYIEVVRRIGKLQ